MLSRYDFKPASAIAAADAGVLSTLTVGVPPPAPSSRTLNSPHRAPLWTPRAARSKATRSRPKPACASVSSCSSAPPDRSDLSSCATRSDSSANAARERAACPPKLERLRRRTLRRPRRRPGHRRNGPVQQRLRPSRPARSRGFCSRAQQAPARPSRLATATATAAASVSGASNSSTPNPILVPATTAESSAPALPLASSSVPAPNSRACRRALTSTKTRRRRRTDEPPRRWCHCLRAHCSTQSRTRCTSSRTVPSSDRHATYEILAASSSTQLNQSGSPELRLLTVDQVAHDLELSPTSSAFSPQVTGYTYTSCARYNTLLNKLTKH